MARVYGEIAGYPLHSTFRSRAELAAAGVHRPMQAGISGGKDGADSIVVSGGYVDDEDYGYYIIYTGEGGRDPITKKQVADQTLTRGNAGLVRNYLEGNPVRVVRGAGSGWNQAPSAGYRYDGLFRVDHYWHQPGRDNFRIWRFRLSEMTVGPAVPLHEYDQEPQPASRVEAHLQRLVRNTAVASRVKELHQYRCQVCGVQLSTPGGPYAEAAHIRALGRPHNGADVPGNVLCLCPNDHVRFDAGGIFVEEDGTIRDGITGETVGELYTIPQHPIDCDQLTYHRHVHGP